MTSNGPADAVSPGTGTGTCDVVALGESMVTFLPTLAGRLADVPSFLRGIGGAESNVACALARAGHSARWVGRVGADGFGDHLVRAIAAYGVDTSAVRRDPTRPTGVYFRTAGDRGTDAHEVAYYRAGSAASAMTAENTDLAAVRSGRVLHLSGITAALSDGALALMRELTAPRPGRPLVSFDVNHRPALWRGRPGGPRVLLDLARGADIVFVGEDEAREAWGLHGARAIREALPEPDVLVVKDGERGAVVFASPTAAGPRGGATALHASAPAHRDPRAADATGERPEGATGRCADTAGAAGRGEDAVDTPGRGENVVDTAVFVPAPRVDVVAAVGAGDAFAAGFLSATLRGLPVRDRLRHGHLAAAAALTVPGDLADPPARGHADRLAALGDHAWETLRLGPGWTEADARAAEEVRTP
ncbi:sugar kinase [Streptomyces aureus]|uniref:sugar kinase n=1 Tax=Streptomyces aureus TaxID=193461 RepID=UPI000691645B|nr:sugar kinase [Streptomyces aureus]